MGGTIYCHNSHFTCVRKKRKILSRYEISLCPVCVAMHTNESIQKELFICLLENRSSVMQEVTFSWFRSRRLIIVPPPSPSSILLLLLNILLWTHHVMSQSKLFC